MKTRLVLLLAVCLAGCGGDEIKGTVGGGFTRIGKTFVGFGKRGEGTVLLICCDLDDSEKGGGGGSGSSPHGLTFRGLAHSKDGRTVDWVCQTPDGKSGAVRINGQHFKLEEGSLFLVTTRGGQTQIEQHRRDLMSVAPDDENLERFTKEDPDVKQFISQIEALK